MFSLQTIFFIGFAAILVASWYTKKARPFMLLFVSLALIYSAFVPNFRVQYIPDYSSYPSVECKDEPCRELEKRLNSVNADTLKLQENFESLDDDHRFLLMIVAMFFFWATYRRPIPKSHDDDIQQLGLNK